MSVFPSGLSESTKRRLKSLQRTDTKDNPSVPHKVNTQLCNLINDMYDDGVKPSEIISHIPVSSPDTVYRHIRGDCKHNYSTGVSYDECGWMRYYAHKGASTGALACLYNISKRSVTKHLKGNCSHNSKLEPLTEKQIYLNSRDIADTITSICPECDNEFEHKSYIDRTFCSESCNGKYAGRKAHE